MARSQMGQEVRVNVYESLQVCGVHMAAEIYLHILYVFEGILNKAGGIFIRSVPSFTVYQMVTLSCTLMIHKY